VNVAIVSAFPPVRSGVADYAARIADSVAQHADVTRISFPEGADLKKFDAVLYHMGNHALHGPIYEAALAIPGALVLHDAMLHHFALGWLAKERYVEEFVYNYGEWFRDFAEDLWQQRALSAVEERYFSYPMLRRLVERCPCVIVHNPAAHRTVEETALAAGASTRVADIPLFADLPELIDDDERMAIRRRLGVSDKEVVVSCLGFLRPAKRLRSLFDAVDAVSLPLRILLVGEINSPDYAASLAPRLAQDNVTYFPYVDAHEFQRLGSISDVAVSLRYPSTGETSAITMQMMALEKATIVTDSEETSALPSDAVLRVHADESETEMLAHYLSLLGQHPEVRDRYGRNARRHVAENHSLEHATGLYLDILRRLANSGEETAAALTADHGAAV
jgi:glycosyltransferase involved in cell wall biosynthesis